MYVWYEINCECCIPGNISLYGMYTVYKWSLSVHPTVLYPLFIYSESSSNIEDSRPVTATPCLHPADHIPTLHNDHAHHSHHVPSSLVYDLSTRRIHRTTEVTFATPPRVHSGRPRLEKGQDGQKRVSSFSRELSRRPLDALRKYPARRGGEEGGERGMTKTEEEPAHPPPTQADTASRDHQLTLLVPDSLFTADPGNIGRRVGSISNARYPYGNPVVPRAHVPQRTSFGHPPLLTCTGRTAQSGAQLPSRVSDAAKSDRGKMGQKVFDNTLQISSRHFTFRAGVAAKSSSIEDIPRLQTPDAESNGQKKSHIVHFPRHSQLPPSTRSYSNRPFSEDASTVTPSPEMVYLEETPPKKQRSKERSSPGASGVRTAKLLKPKLVNEEEQQVMDSGESEEGNFNPSHRPPSISPDCMLVGARFSGNQLVLLNSEGRIVHQLTETDSEANIAFSETCVEGRAALPSNKLPMTIAVQSLPPPQQSLPPPPSRLTGTRPPPPTAADGVRAHGLLQSKTVTDSYSQVELEPEENHKTSTDSGSAASNPVDPGMAGLSNPRRTDSPIIGTGTGGDSNPVGGGPPYDPESGT